MHQYVLFDSPGSEFRERRDWTRKEAEAYLAWINAAYVRRSDDLLSYLEIGRTGSPEIDLRNAQRILVETVIERVLTCITYDQLYTPARAELGLNETGMSLAFDLGLYFIRIVLERFEKQVALRLGPKPRNEMNYNHAVLVPIVETETPFIINPILYCYQTVQANLNDDSARDQVADLYSFCSQQLAK